VQSGWRAFNQLQGYSAAKSGVNSRQKFHLCAV
jgi:hypothetical protein